MKPHCKPLATALAATLQLAAIAAVPVAWTNSPGLPPYQIKPVPHGSTVDLACTLKGYTTPPIADGADVRLWYQTNGMGSAWWSAPATFDGSTITATFGPAQDCGADRVSLFFGAPSNVFASAVLRLTHAPGFAPSSLPLPVPAIDFATVELRNLSALTNGWSFGSTIDLTASTNYTDSALGAFAATGAVARASSYGTPTRWTDATGCVWEVGYSDWVIEYNDPAMAYYGVRLVESGQGDGAYWIPYVGEAPSGEAKGYADSTEIVWLNEAIADFRATRTLLGTTNLVGRVAYTNDIPPKQEWPAELVHTNTPLIFVDGQDTNVTSLALRAQPTNYTALSWMYPVSYYLPNRFSLLELGHDYQIAAAQWFQVGRYLYAQNPENIVFVGGGQHRSLQDYLDACSPQTMADLLSCYIPTNGGGRIHGDLTIDGRLTAGELITITNSDIHAKGFQVVNKVLTADGLMASNGMVRLNCARFVIGFGTPRIHLETNDLSAITYGGTWENPAGSVFSWQDSKIQNYLAGDIGQQDIELRNPYMRYMDVKDGFMGWKIKGHNVNNGPLKHFTLDNYRTHHFTDADVGNYGIEFTIASNAHVRIVYDFASAPPSAVYFFCGRDGNDESATMLSNGTELLAPTAGVKTLLEIEHLSGWTFIVKETPLTYQNTVMPWIQAQEEEP